MPLLFQTLLTDAGFDLGQTILLRHRPGAGVDPLIAWRTRREDLEVYQSIQIQKQRTIFARPHWAAFAGLPGGRTIFLGMYAGSLIGPAPIGATDPLTGAELFPERHDLYRCEPLPQLAEYSTRLFIRWGEGTRSWVQRGTTAKPITELYETYKDPEFPGYLELLRPLSELSMLPPAWVEMLRHGRGVYLLTCPRTREQYVGKADGAGGFWGRWKEYAATGHGGNVRLKARDLSDYQVSILEVAGSSATAEEIGQMETRWKLKLQSREMGLNAN